MRRKANTPEKEVLAALKAILKFQVHIINTHFTLRTDCSSLKGVLEKDAKDLAAKLIFARWQAMFSLFRFDIEHIKGESNSLPEFLTREYLQGGTGRISMMRTVRKKTEWFPTTGDRVLGSIPRSDYFPGQPWATADLRPRAGCLRRRMVLDGLDESGLRMTGAAYVKHHFDGRGNISHSVCIRKDQLKAPEAEGRVFKFSSGNLIGFFTLFNGLKDWSFSCRFFPNERMKLLFSFKPHFPLLSNKTG